MTVLLIITVCFILYRAGMIGHLLERCKMEHATATTTGTTQPQHPALTEREQLEIDARYIIERQGHNPDTVTYMSDGLLQAIITDYKNEIRKGGNN